jgi:hypothetical protein
MSGQWRYEVRYERSAWNPYKGMRVQYVAQLVQDRAGKISGTAEKTLDIEADGKKRAYIGRWRIAARVTGQIAFSMARRGWLINIHVEEFGEQRNSSSTHELVAKWKESSLRGAFTSTIADSAGHVVWKKEPFLNL